MHEDNVVNVGLGCMHCGGSIHSNIHTWCGDELF